MHLLLFLDTSIKQELYLFVQGSMFAFGDASSRRESTINREMQLHYGGNSLP